MGDVVKGVLGGVVIGALAFFTGGAGLGLLGTTTLLGSVAVGAVAGGLTGLFKPKIPELSTEFGRELQLNGDPAAVRKVCYGEAWTAGTLRYWNTDGDNNEDLYFVIVLAGHEIDSVQTVEIDGSTVALDGSGNVTSPSKWAGLLNVRTYLGTDDQTADATLVSLFSADPIAPWTTDHRLRGLPYAIVKFTFDEEDLNSLPQIRFKIRGRKVYDPRLDSTNGGTGAHRLADPSTWEWSRNAVLCGNDFIRGVKVNSRAIAGMRVADTRFDWSNVIAEANVCDEDVALAAGGTQDRYTVDGFIDPRQDHGANIRHFEAAIAGDITFADGKWRFFAGAFRSPTLHLEDKHFIGPLRHTVHKGESARVDAIQGVFASAVDSGDVLDYPPVLLSSATTGEERFMRMDFALVSNGARAQRCAKLMLEREAAGKRISCTTSLYGFRAVPGETIEITRSSFGLTAQDMRVLDVQLTIVKDGDKVGLAVELILEAGPSSLYTWAAEETAIAAVPTIPRAQVPFDISFPSLVGGLTGSGLLLNGGFESGDTDGWTQGSGAGTFSTSTGVDRSGTYAGLLRMQIAASGVLADQTVPAPPAGERVLLQAFATRSSVNLPNRNLQLVIRWGDSVNASIGASVIDTASSALGGYQALSGVATVPSGAVFMTYRWQKATPNNTDETGDWFVDDCSLHVIPKNADIDLGEASGAVDTTRIGDEAVTTIASAEDASGSLSNGGGTVLQLFEMTAQNVEYTLVVTATLNVWITNDGGGTPQFELKVLGDTISETSQPAIPSATASPGERITLQMEVAVTPSEEPMTAQIVWTGGQPSGTAQYRNASLRAEAVKR